MGLHPRKQIYTCKRPFRKSVVVQPSDLDLELASSAMVDCSRLSARISAAACDRNRKADRPCCRTCGRPS